MVRVYIASPYSIGDKEKNVRRQMEAFVILQRKGFLPHAPLLYHFINKEYPLPESEWLELDFEILKHCDCLIRLPGESVYGDVEVERMKALEKPVFFDFDSLYNAYL